MHSPHWMHPRFRPIADIDTRRTDIDALIAIDAVAGGLAARPQSCVLLERSAWLAPVVAIGDVEGVLVGERRLNARPRAHVKANLLAHVPGKRVGRECQNGDPAIGDQRSLKGCELAHERRRIREIENPGAAGPPRQHQPERMLCARAGEPLDVPGLLVAQKMRAAVAFRPALDGLEEIRPDRLRAQVATPHAAGDGIHQEERHCREDEQSGDVVDFLRPDLDEEEIKPAIRQVEQHRLTGGIRTAIPAQERQPIIDTKRHAEHGPFDAAKCALYPLGINLLARDVERALVIRLRNGRACRCRRVRRSEICALRVSDEICQRRFHRWRFVHRKLRWRSRGTSLSSRRHRRNAHRRRAL